MAHPPSTHGPVRAPPPGYDRAAWLVDRWGAAVSIRTDVSTLRLPWCPEALPPDPEQVLAAATRAGFLVRACRTCVHRCPPSGPGDVPRCAAAGADPPVEDLASCFLHRTGEATVATAELPPVPPETLDPMANV